MKFLNSAYQKTPVWTYIMHYLRTYHKLEKPEIAFSSKTGSKADIENRAMLRHVELITDHFDTQFGYVNPQG